MTTHSITRFENGKWRQNCYLVSYRLSQLLIIDPGSDTEEIVRLITEQKATPVAVLNTHAHYDHIGSVSELLERYQIPFYLHGADRKLLQQANVYKFLFDSKSSIAIPAFDKDLQDCQNELKIGDFIVKVISTPGHTAGSVCFILGNDIFTGDTVLPKGPGRTDLPGGNKHKLIESVDELRKLPGDMHAHPGHGNSFLLSDLWERLDG